MKKKQSNYPPLVALANVSHAVCTVEVCQSIIVEINKKNVFVFILLLLEK